MGAPEIETAYQVLVSCAGLGALEVNTVVLPLLSFNKLRSTTIDDILLPTQKIQMNLQRTPTHFEKITKKLKQHHKEPEDSPSVKNTDNDNASGVTQNEDAYSPQLMNTKSFHSPPNLAVASTYINLLKDALILQKNIMVTRNYDKIDQSHLPLPKRYRFASVGKVCPNIDVYFDVEMALSKPQLHKDIDLEVNIDFDDTKALLLMLGNILQNNKRWGEKSKLRIIKILPPGPPTTEEHHNEIVEQLDAFCKRLRINCSDILVKQCPPPVDTESMDPKFQEMDRYRTMNEIVKEVSSPTLETEEDEESKTIQVYMDIPFLHKDADLATSDEDAKHYIQCLDILTYDLPPVALCKLGEDAPVLTSDL